MYFMCCWSYFASNSISFVLPLFRAAKFSGTVNFSLSMGSTMEKFFGSTAETPGGG